MLAIILRKRPSELLGLKGEERQLFEVDFNLTMNSLEMMAEGDEESIESKIEEMKKWREERKRGSH